LRYKFQKTSATFLFSHLTYASIRLFKHYADFSVLTAVYAHWCSLCVRFWIPSTIQGSLAATSPDWDFVETASTTTL